jgi:rubrerythrin
MIEVNLSTMLLIYLSVILSSFIAFWVYSEYKQKDKSVKIESERYFWSCSICGYTYVDSKHKEISICPRCGSYNKKEE